MQAQAHDDSFMVTISKSVGSTRTQCDGRTAVAGGSEGTQHGLRICGKIGPQRDLSDVAGMQAESIWPAGCVCNGAEATG